MTFWLELLIIETRGCMAKITYKNLNRQYMVADQTEYEKLMKIRTQILADEQTIYNNMTEQTQGRDKRQICHLEEVLMQVDALILKCLHNMLGLVKFNLSIYTIGEDCDYKLIDKLNAWLQENSKLKVDGMISARGVSNQLYEVLQGSLKMINKDKFKGKNQLLFIQNCQNAY